MRPGYFNGNRPPASNPLETPSRRARLATKAGRNPVWTQLAGRRGGVSLGYRPRSNGPGVWSARLIYRGVRRETLLGDADDPGHQPDALGYAAAAHAALAWAAGEKAVLDQAEPHAAVDVTLRDAIATYCAGRGGENGRNAARRLTRHVLSDTRLADTRLAQLTPTMIAAWRRGLSPMKPSSRNRLINDLRAGITAAMPSQILPPPLRAALRAEPGATTAREIQVLTTADLRGLLQAADQLDANFGHLVRLLATTGARFSQLTRLQVSDLQIAPGRSRLLVPASAKGRASKAGTKIPVPISDDTADRLSRLTHGRKGHEILLLRRPGVPWGQSGKMIAPWRQALAAAGLPTDLVPYVLRHSSIVRMLNQSVPIRFVAASHDTSVKMLEAHYARYITGEIEDRVRVAVISLESAEIVTLPARATSGETG
jgi:integrase